MTDDQGVSELMGYTVLVAVVSIASVALLAGSMGTLSSSEKSLEHKGSVASLRSLDGILAGLVQSNSTYDTAFQMSVPSGCDLIVKDKHDDFRSVAIYEDSTPLAFMPMGSVALVSPFRTVTCEGGAVISNQSGLVDPEVKPAIRAVTLPSGKRSLYVSVTSISGDSYIAHSGLVTLYARSNSSNAYSWHIPDGSGVVIFVRSGDPSVWKEAFEDCGFAITNNNGAVKATCTNISDVYLNYAEAEVRE